MPYSLGVFDKEVKSFLDWFQGSRFLDVGAGAGKYGVMIRSSHPTATITAIEPDDEYIHRFELDKIYDEIIRNEAKVLVSEPDYSVDLVIMGDVIEHMLKSEGIDFLNYIVYRCRWVIVIYPIEYLQGSVEGHELEAHRSVWGRMDFEGLNVWSFEVRGGIGMVVIKGYLES